MIGKDSQLLPLQIFAHKKKKKKKMDLITGTLIFVLAKFD